MYCVALPGSHYVDTIHGALIWTVHMFRSSERGGVFVEQYLGEANIFAVTNTTFWNYNDEVIVYKSLGSIRQTCR